MEKNFYLELLGYAVAALIAVSLTMTSIRRRRLINLVGAVGFAISECLTQQEHGHHQSIELHAHG